MTQQHGRFYTRTRRIPVTFGKFPSGERIPGGPYTGVQFVGALLAGVLLLGTHWLWGTGTALVDVVMGLGLAYGVVVVLKRAPDSLHEVRLTISGVFRLAFVSGSGTCRGRPVDTRAPRKSSPGSSSRGESGGQVVSVVADDREIPAESVRGSGFRRDSSVERLLRDAGQRAGN